MKVVLVASGKNDDHRKTGVKVFDSEAEALHWCIAFNKDNAHGKHWQYANIIEEGIFYEVLTLSEGFDEFEYWCNCEIGK